MKQTYVWKNEKSESKRGQVLPDKPRSTQMHNVNHVVLIVSHADSEIVTGEIASDGDLTLTRHGSGRVEIIVDAYAYYYEEKLKFRRCPIPTLQRFTLDLD